MSATTLPRQWNLLLSGGPSGMRS
ncbi:hypothetical protein CORC01_06612 [Colletotrichum orchidophilum]|uniref:Uncharacterized protein n=1 Tax=Colletotrichum orchidophilum TaxID=1209926 RepID=A0A1G4B9M4_9PEZI|nr:hypothetical protein CORC01_06612 [Colletotrichum orchidophilum]